MIYDCFSFYNELDLLEIRLNVLKDVVDRFVLVEATKTHTGKPKPLYYKENAERFTAFKDKIVHVVVDDFSDPPTDYTEQQASWMRENFQRNSIIRGIRDAKPDDIIIVGDADEIPRPEVIARAKDTHFTGVVTLCLDISCYYLNFKNFVHQYITATKMLSYGALDDPKTWKNRIALDKHDPNVNRGRTLTAIRCMRTPRAIKHAGWHFSYMGGADAIVRKIGAIAIEYANENNTNSEWLKKAIENGEDITGCGGRFFVVPLDSSFPKYVLDNREKYSAYIYEPDADYYRRTKWARRRCFWRGWIRRNGAKLIPHPFKQFLYDHVYCKLVKEPIVV